MAQSWWEINNNENINKKFTLLSCKNVNLC